MHPAIGCVHLVLGCGHPALACVHLVCVYIYIYMNFKLQFGVGTIRRSVHYRCSKIRRWDHLTLGPLGVRSIRCWVILGEVSLGVQSLGV